MQPCNAVEHPRRLQSFSARLTRFLAFSSSFTMRRLSPAHHVIGNVYYVGTADYASFLITSEQGHILINPDYQDSVDLIKASVEKLGFLSSKTLRSF